MFDVCLLGTSGMLPLPNRWLTSCLIRYGGTSLLIDCGEGTQITMRMQGWSFKDIDTILFTHYHADHVAGLPGLLLTIGNSGRTEPITIIGPKGLKRVLDGLLQIARGLPFQVLYRELTAEEIDGQLPIERGPLIIKSCRCDHGVPCVGYSVQISRKPRFDPDRAKAANIPLPYWHCLQNGETVRGEDGTVFTPDMVLGGARRGLKVTYATDSRPKDTIVSLAKGSDLFICEGMYGAKDKQEKVKEHKHMSFQEAAAMAKAAGVSELWLTHFSPAMPQPKDYLPEAAAIFANTRIGRDRQTRELTFEED